MRIGIILEFSGVPAPRMITNYMVIKSTVTLAVPHCYAPGSSGGLPS